MSHTHLNGLAAVLILAALVLVGCELPPPPTEGSPSAPAPTPAEVA